METIDISGALGLIAMVVLTLNIVLGIMLSTAYKQTKYWQKMPTKRKAYKIIDIQSTGSQYVYMLDKNLPSASYLNINHFTVRRRVKDYITGVALDTNLVMPIEAGFMLPEYPSQTLKQNLPNILNDLYGKTLI